MQSTLALDNLEIIGGYAVTKCGKPELVETSAGKAVAFNGIDQGLVLRGNPLNNALSFTIEVVFKATSSYPENVEQRFLHIQNLNNENSRILIELRLTSDNHWFLDTFIKSDDSALTLYAENFLHPINEWYHVALVYHNGTMRHYVNGNEEMSGNVSFTPIEDGDTSIGMRINKISWFRGLIKTVRMTKSALSPEDFMDALPIL